MIVDGHLHLWEAASAVSPLPYLLPTSVASINELEKEMRPAGVTHAVLVQPQVHRQDHSLLGAVLSRDLDRDRGVGLVDDNVAESDIPGEVERLAGLGMAGIRVHLIDNQEAMLQRLLGQPKMLV